LARARQNHERFVAVVTRLIELIHGGHVAEAHEAQLTEAQPLANSLERLTNQLVNACFATSSISPRLLAGRRWADDRPARPIVRPVRCACR
jgi:hypothetical protein